MIFYLIPHLSGRISANKENKIYVLAALVQRDFVLSPLTNPSAFNCLKHILVFEYHRNAKKKQSKTKENNCKISYFISRDDQLENVSGVLSK